MISIVIDNQVSLWLYIQSITFCNKPNLALNEEKVTVYNQGVLLVNNSIYLKRYLRVLYYTLINGLSASRLNFRAMHMQTNCLCILEIIYYFTQ